MSEIEQPADPQHRIEHPGDPRHPDHRDFLFALGEATYMAAQVAKISFDLLRVFDGRTSESLYRDPLGDLQKKVLEASKRPGADPKMREFAQQLATAITDRNDLTHALPVKDGLWRVRGPVTIEFYTVESVKRVTVALEDTLRIGVDLLHFDGGAKIAAWAAAGGS